MAKLPPGQTPPATDDRQRVASRISHLRSSGLRVTRQSPSARSMESARVARRMVAVLDVVELCSAIGEREISSTRRPTPRGLYLRTSRKLGNGPTPPVCQQDVRPCPKRIGRRGCVCFLNSATHGHIPRRTVQSPPRQRTYKHVAPCTTKRVAGVRTLHLIMGADQWAAARRESRRSGQGEGEVAGARAATSRPPTAIYARIAGGRRGSGATESEGTSRSPS